MVSYHDIIHCSCCYCYNDCLLHYTIVSLTLLSLTIYRADKDGDGTISEKELKIFLKSLGQNPTDKEVHDMVKAVDDNGNGLIDFSEFIQLMSMGGAEKEEDAALRAAFKEFDQDGNGTISRAELKLTMKKLGDNLTDEMIDRIIEEVDADGNGEIDFEEFVVMMKNK